MLGTLAGEGEDGDREEIRSFISEKLGKPPERMQDTSRISSLGIDSLSLWDLEMDIESNYYFTFPERKGFRTIGDIVSYILENSLRYKQ